MKWYSLHIGRASEYANSDAAELVQEELIKLLTYGCCCCYRNDYDYTMKKTSVEMEMCHVEKLRLNLCAISSYAQRPVPHRPKTSR